MHVGQKGIPAMDRGCIRKGPWSAEEDTVLRDYVNTYGARDWSSIRSKGLLPRTGKSCRLRWVNKLQPNLKTGCKFSEKEEGIVIDMQSKIGNKWAQIATLLPGRTDNDVKNFWSTRQKRLARLLNTSLPSRSGRNPGKVPVHAQVSNFEGCPTRKQVERSRAHPTMFIATYSSEHNHAWPPVHKITKPVKPSIAEPVEPSVAKPASDPEEKFSNLIDEESSLLIHDDFHWPPSNSSAAAGDDEGGLYEPLFVRASLSDDCAKFSGRGGGSAAVDKEEDLFAGLSELPEYSVIDW